VPFQPSRTELASNVGIEEFNIFGFDGFGVAAS
jgi:hypothetical protein